MGEAGYVDQVPAAVNARIPEGWRGGSGIGQGWFGLVEDLDAKVAEVIPDYQVLQCKEKFGGLRYYVEFPEGIDAEVGVGARARALVGEAEEKSLHICEECGGEGRTGGQGWITTLCDKDREAREVLRREMLGK